METNIRNLENLESYVRRMRYTYTKKGVEELCTNILAYLILIKNENHINWTDRLKSYIKKVKAKRQNMKKNEICDQALYLLE